ncbi:helix-turn-helix domain-containing protein [Rhodococcus sp. NPDC058505]|uniref:helix-turn-helix domain-containing protein n=1 Tax=unclassified Rhodococcus (in: high G+C Gram-positive bacteria) TaxID=192944 RepID=UPI003646AC42
MNVDAPISEAQDLKRVHAEGLADIRKAGNLTQQQVAALLDTDQGTVSRIERRDDLLLSTLRQYLAATGAEHAKIVIEKEGVEIVLDLDTFA